MKIKFKKLQATQTFARLFGKKGSETTTPGDGAANEEYEYYHRRGNTYYFRNNGGEKFSVDYNEPQTELVRGSRYKMDAINNRNS
jgi:hypothetical protein